MQARALCLAALGVLAASTPALAQKTSTQAIEEYREMLQDGNPADLYEMKGAELWTKKRGPKGEKPRREARARDPNGIPDRAQA